MASQETKKAESSYKNVVLGTGECFFLSSVVFNRLFLRPGRLWLQNIANNKAKEGAMPGPSAARLFERSRLAALTLRGMATKRGD